MRIRTKSCLISIAIALAALAAYAEVRPATDVLWLDFDMRNIPEPKERRSDFYVQFFELQLVEQWKRCLDVTRWARAASGHPKAAKNVNAVDEVPDSSWYTNRHYLRRMTIDQLARGPDENAGPDFTDAVITKAKTVGVTPGMQLKDRKGDSYLIKFDDANYPELQSAAEVIATKILYAAGYNVPENYVAYVRPEELQIKDGVQFTDETKQKQPFTRQALDEMLSRVARMPDGRYRALASKILPGKPKGPFVHAGLRRDDPNDLIPHEQRRELRGLRVISSWINHWDMKEDNSLDMYVGENGRKFLRHYLIDFGSALGGGNNPLEYFHGREYLFDSKSILKEIFTLGLAKTADEKAGIMFSPQVGIFTADDFDPGDWKPTFPVMAFADMTDEDAFWATRIILSFTESELRRIVETGQYADPRNTEYVLQTLLKRRQMIARHWLAKVNPIASFSIESKSEGIELTFHDFMPGSGIADAPATGYFYRIEGKHYKSIKQTTRNPLVFIDRAELGAAIESDGANTPIEVTIWTNRHGSSTDPVKVYFYWSPDRDKFSVQRISRG